MQDSAALVRKWLKQCLAHEKLVPSHRSKAGPVTAAELNSLVDDLTANKGKARGMKGRSHAQVTPNVRGVLSLQVDDVSFRKYDPTVVFTQARTKA